MAKLLPPSIESKLPAQIGDTLSIPFLQNRSVSPAQYEGMALKIKTVATNLEIGILYGNKQGVFTHAYKINEDETINQVEIFNKLVTGQFYKVQLAYYIIKDNKPEPGYFSTAGVFKYIGQPIVFISTSKAIELNPSARNYIGSQVVGNYEVPEAAIQNSEKTYKDTNERVYSYRFNIYKDNELLTTSGELFHNSSNDKATDSSYDIYTITNVLDNISLYQIEYIVTTSNGLTVSSPRYTFAYGAEVDPLANINLQLEPSYDTGSIKVYIKPATEITLGGKYRLVRFSSLDNYSTREIISEFEMGCTLSNTHLLLNDYTVQQGVSYKYGFQQYNNNGITTKLIESAPILVDFEDMFLSDGERQLKIKFNPKVTSFKTTILENKLDTLGGQYPFIFRNGRTNYKEFPISGLISYWMDNEEMFMSCEELRLNAQSERRNATAARQFEEQHTYTTNLTGDNFFSEREFKLQVLDWLNNGKPKLFRSPAEGNYIVRLLNVSLSPSEQLGRMLHTFNSQAYEIATNTLEELQKLNLISKINNILTPVTKFETFQVVQGQTVAIDNAVWVRLYGDIGSKYVLIFKNGTSKDIYIGVTGVYELSLQDNTLISVILEQQSQSFNWEHKIEYAYNLVDQVPIVDSTGREVISIHTSEKAAQLVGENDLTSLLGENETLENVLVLSFEEIEQVNTDENSDITMIINGQEQSINLHNNNNQLQNILGRYVITAREFENNKMLLTNLNTGSNIKTDIYYVVNTTTYKEA